MYRTVNFLVLVTKCQRMERFSENLMHFRLLFQKLVTHQFKFSTHVLKMVDRMQTADVLLTFVLWFEVKGR